MIDLNNIEGDFDFIAKVVEVIPGSWNESILNMYVALNETKHRGEKKYELSNTESNKILMRRIGMSEYVSMLNDISIFLAPHQVEILMTNKPILEEFDPQKELEEDIMYGTAFFEPEEHSEQPQLHTENIHTLNALDNTQTSKESKDLDRELMLLLGHGTHTEESHDIPESETLPVLDNPFKNTEAHEEHPKEELSDLMKALGHGAPEFETKEPDKTSINTSGKALRNSISKATNLNNRKPTRLIVITGNKNGNKWYVPFIGATFEIFDNDSTRNYFIPNTDFNRGAIERHFSERSLSSVFSIRHTLSKMRNQTPSVPLSVRKHDAKEVNPSNTRLADFLNGREK